MLVIYQCFLGFFSYRFVLNFPQHASPYNCKKKAASGQIASTIYFTFEFYPIVDYLLAIGLIGLWMDAGPIYPFVF